MPWRADEHGTLAPKDRAEIETLLKGVFDKRRFLQLLRDFIVFGDTGSGIAKIRRAEARLYYDQPPCVFHRRCEHHDACDHQHAARPLEARPRSSTPNRPAAITRFDGRAKEKSRLLEARLGPVRK